VILQQDAFDEIDASTPIERQKFMMDLVIGIVQDEYDFESFEEVSAYFRGLINILKQMNYSEFESDDFKKFESQLKEELDKQKAAQTV